MGMILRWHSMSFAHPCVNPLPLSMDGTLKYNISYIIMAKNFAVVIKSINNSCWNKETIQDKNIWLSDIIRWSLKTQY
jgi:hypothetical protein